MNKFYSDEESVQILVALLKSHGIRKAILSPGSANSPFVASLQHDKYFETYSCVDERSAAYMACGLAEESGEPVIISCTGATASRNYFPGVTEAYYRKLPVLAITSTQTIARVGHHIAQVVDRSTQPNDSYVLSRTLPIVNDALDRLECEVKVNEAILALRKAGGGPVHLNLQTSSLGTFKTQQLPTVRKISLVEKSDLVPEIEGNKVAVFVGSRRRWSTDEVSSVERFCEKNNGAVLCDHTSGYSGRFKIVASLLGGQEFCDFHELKPDLVIHIGEITGDYYGTRVLSGNVWRVSEDGVVRDTFGRLTTVFRMTEREFFDKYSYGSGTENTYYDQLKKAYDGFYRKMPEFPFSNIWLASQCAHDMPAGSVINFGILSCLRSWNFFLLPESVNSTSNVGGFGIDGCLSATIGASLAAPDKPCFAIIGDLAFFYDLNALGNRHVGSNLRVLLVNNGMGVEFRTYKHHTAHFGDMADEFIAAAGHFGNKSPTLVRHFAESLGFQYFSASNKEEFLEVRHALLDPNPHERPMLVEVFTNVEDEHKALELARNLDVDKNVRFASSFKSMVKSNMSPKAVSAIKRMFSSD